MTTANLPARKGEEKHEVIQLVSFNLGSDEYAVEVLKVREIIRLASITPVPNTPAGVEGIINLRGRVIPIVSLRKRFHLGACEHDHHTRIIVMEIAGKLMGFVVDGVSEVIRVSNDQIQPPPAISAGGVDQEFISGVIKHADQLVLLLELEQMFSSEEQESFFRINA